jgi:hypothetical protein
MSLSLSLYLFMQTITLRKICWLSGCMCMLVPTSVMICMCVCLFDQPPENNISYIFNSSYISNKHHQQLYTYKYMSRWSMESYFVALSHQLTSESALLKIVIVLMDFIVGMSRIAVLFLFCLVKRKIELKLLKNLKPWFSCSRTN